jgi:hypothetical protein
MDNLFCPSKVGIGLKKGNLPKADGCQEILKRCEE